MIASAHAYPVTRPVFCPHHRVQDNTPPANQPVLIEHVNGFVSGRVLSEDAA